jgi:hypothetical protein
MAAGIGKSAQISVGVDRDTGAETEPGVSCFACTRAHAIDLAATAILFVTASLAAGRVWRFPFDDEIYTLSLIKQQSALELLTVFPTRQDVHPPLSYLLFHALQQLGLSDAGMRLCSLIMTATALALFQILVSTWIAQRGDATHSLAIRLVAVTLFGLTPLAVGQGDALRWYPLFALFVALFVTLYLAPRNRAAQLCSGAALGLAASTNLAAAILVPPFLLYRYGLQRRFCWSFDLPYWLLAACAGALGIYSAFWVFARRLALVHTQFANTILAPPIDALGFFGGDALGVSQSWIVVPAAIISAIAFAAAIDRRQPQKPVHLLLLIIAATALMALAGFAKPRSFLYLAPMVAALLTSFFATLAGKGQGRRVLIMLSLILTTSISAIASINFTTHPFKRNSVIPYQAILDFIHANKTGRTFVISTDPVIPWVLGDSGRDLCVGYFLQSSRCLVTGQRFDSIFIVSGHSDKSANAALMRKFNSVIDEVTAGRSKVATLQAGIDDDAALKTRLTGVPLDRHILNVEYYR